MPSDSRPPETHEIKKGEAALVYCADFSNEPAVTAGATLVTPSIYEVENSRVTIGANPQVNSAAAFVQYGEDGEVLATVPQGKGVKIEVTGVSKGPCRVSVKCTMSDGQAPIVDAIFVVT